MKEKELLSEPKNCKKCGIQIFKKIGYNCICNKCHSLYSNSYKKVFILNINDNENELIINRKNNSKVCNTCSIYKNIYDFEI